MASSPIRIRLLTLNTWHGLNPYQPWLMLPLQGALAMRRRYRRQEVKLKAEVARSPGATVLCFQELNPWWIRIRRLSRILRMAGDGVGINGGLRFGFWGYPPFLDEGLGILHDKRLARVKHDSMILSGNAFRSRGILGIPLSLQVRENRGAQRIRFQVSADLTVAVVNLHLHNGPANSPSEDRRKAEVRKLLQWLEPSFKKDSLIFIAGDFNSIPDAPELKLLQEAGFQETRVLEGKEAIPTWDPDANDCCRISVSSAPVGSAREWDAETQAFDQIYVRKAAGFMRSFQLKTLTSRCFDGADAVSDHFGLRCDVEILAEG